METKVESFKEFIQSLSALWKRSKLFRITSLVSGTVTGYIILRNLYIVGYRKYIGLPNGLIGLPLIGHSTAFLNPGFLSALAIKYPYCASVIIGPYNAIIINEPRIARKVYSDPRTLNTPDLIGPKVKMQNQNFILSNGKAWSERRRIIYANLMTTVNQGTYVERVTKQFIKTKVFPIFDEDIQNGKVTNVKPLFRPIGFNIVLQACFGKELQSLDDPFWLKFDKQMTDNSSNATLRSLLINIFGNGIFGINIQRWLTGDDLANGFRRLNDILDEYATNGKYNVAIDDKDDIKLFNDYVENYENNTDGAKYTRRQLLGDMSVMFLAALTYSLLLAAKYPAIQEEIFEEITNAFGNDVNNIELRNNGIRKMNKLRALYDLFFTPFSFLGPREIKDNGFIIDATQHDGNVYNVPKGTMIMINLIGIAQTAKYWVKDYDENKHKDIDMNNIHFEFWLDENGNFKKKKNSDNFFTFHIGKRDCVGQSLAIKELIIVLAMIFMKYRIKQDDNPIQQYFSIVMEPKNTEIRLESR